jgi:hypothetical protein
MDMEQPMNDDKPAGAASALTEVLGLVPSMEWGEQWVIARQTVIDDLPGRPRLGYTVIAPLERGATGFFASCEDAIEALHRESRPLGWVIMRARQLLTPNDQAKGLADGGTPADSPA